MSSLARTAGRYAVECRIATWTFLTNHARVLLYLAREHNIRLRDIAERVGITERAAHRIVSELCEEGYLTRHRLGARNYYEVNVELPLRHPYEGDHTVGELLAPLLRRRPTPEPDDEPRGASRPSS